MPHFTNFNTPNDRERGKKNPKRKYKFQNMFSHTERNESIEG